jgi:trans-aconitate methyltransferase
MFDTPEAAANTELEGEVLIDFVRTSIETASAHAERSGLTVHRVLDLGSGPGVGSCLWAEAFPTAVVTAVDGSQAMLDRAGARAVRLGLGDRVTTARLDLAGDLSVLGRHDVVFASMSLHHVGDETAALVSIRDLIETNGLIVLLERAGHVNVTFADDTAETAELWSRVNNAWSRWFTDMRAALPGAAVSPEYPKMFATAGYDVLEDRVLSVELTAPLTEPARRFARSRMERSKGALADYTDQDTLTIIHQLLDDLDGAGSNRWFAAEVTATQRLLVGRVR